MKKLAILALALATLSSCMQNAAPQPLNAVRPTTGKVNTERHTVKMVCGRAYGKSTGFKLLGIIPIKNASESEAIDRMYENARARGAQLEGPRQFVNTSYEESANYFILGSVPVIHVAADLVEIQDNGGGSAAGAAPQAAAEQEEESSFFSSILQAPLKLYSTIFGSVFGS